MGMVPLCLFLSLATLSQARSITPPVADSNQVPVSETRFNDGAVNFGSGMPLPGFTPGIGPQYGSPGRPTSYGGPPAYGLHFAYGGLPGYGQQPPTYEGQHWYSSKPGNGGLGYGGKGGGYGQPGYGPGFMSTRVFGGPYGGFGGYSDGLYGGFGRLSGESMVDTLEVWERSMVEVLGDMVGSMASWGQLAVSTPLAIMRTCWMTRMLMTTLMVLTWKKMNICLLPEQG